MMPIDSPQPRLPKLALATAVICFLFAAADLLMAFRQLFLILSAVIPLIAGISILRKRVWGAYGFALIEAAQVAIMLLISFRSAVPKAQLGSAVVVNTVLAVLFFLAGRSLAASGARRGWALPWIALACVVTVPLIFFQAFAILSGGMEDMLLLGDRILVRVLPRANPVRGEIIVFHYPIERSQIFVKRVIGLPGDRIRIVSGVVYRNGVALSEPYAVHKFDSGNGYGDNFPGDVSKLRMTAGSREMAAATEMLRNNVTNGELVVPRGKYFVLGDNRDNSLDSRYWGFVDRSDLIGKPVLIYDSETAAPNRIRWGRVLKFL